MNESIQNKNPDDLTKSELIQERERLISLLTSHESEVMTAGDCFRLHSITNALNTIEEYRNQYRTY